MPIKRVFLGWDEPFINVAATYIFDEHLEGDLCNCHETVCVTPGARAGRLLLRALLERADVMGCSLIPPQFITPGSLPECLYQLEQPQANRLEQLLAWCAAVEKLPDALFARVFRPQVLQEAEEPHPSRYGQKLLELWNDLSSSGVSFADIRKHLERAGEAGQSGRWEVLGDLFETYKAQLAAWGRADLGDSRHHALRANRLDCSKRIVIAGVYDLPRLHEHMLEHVDAGIDILLPAPQAHAAGFSACGTLEHAYWVTGDFSGSSPESVQLLDDPASAGSGIVDVICAISDANGLPADELTIGVTDDGIIPLLQQQLRGVHIETHHAQGSLLQDTPLLQACFRALTFCHAKTFESLAVLVRAPMVQSYVEQHVSVADVIEVCDSYYARHLPHWIDESVTERGEFGSVYHAIKNLCDPFERHAAEIVDWVLATKTYLDAVQGPELSEEDERIVASIHAVFEDLVLSPALQGKQLSREDYSTIFRDAVAVVRLPSAQVPGSLELLSWLELPLDLAANVVVVGVNEPYLPANTSFDMFLSPSLRAALGMTCFEDRWARDVFNFAVLKHSRQNCFSLVFRRNEEGEALFPSRLLVPTEPREAARHLCRMLEEKPKRRSIVFESLSPEAVLDTELVPEPVWDPPSELVLSVTSFRTYLECPYRYYLQHVAKLRGLNDEARELDPASFGDILHAVLQGFAEACVAGSALRDVSRIRAFLEDRLSREMLRRYGAHMQPAVAFQSAQMLQRLNAFADWQAARFEAGWEIQHVELATTEEHRVTLPLASGRTVLLVGRIDRVDWHPKEKRLAIIDYKTADEPKSPIRTHQTRDGSWKDLQLPLYTALAGAHELVADELAYCCLSANKQTEYLPAGWTADELEDALATAASVAEDIYNGVFLPPRELARAQDDYAAICGVGMLHDIARALEGDAE